MKARASTQNALGKVGLKTRRPIPDIKTLKNRLRSNWSGKNLSQKLWGHETWLYDEMADILEKGFTSQESLDSIKRKIAQLISSPTEEGWQSALFNAERLVRTESAAYNTMATLDEMKAHWVEEGILEATLDNRTSDHCRQIDGKVVQLKDAKIGIDLPPFHPWCRTIVVPKSIDDYFGDLDGDEEDLVTLEEAFDAIERRLDEIMDDISPLGQKDKGKKIAITDQAIDKVNLVNIPGHTPEENRTIQLNHKQLLFDARENNNHDEVMYILDKGELLRVYGDHNTVDPNKSHNVRLRLLLSPKRSLTVLHNHPGGSSFSLNDLNMFMETPSVKTMTIVTNQGKVMYLTKMDKFNKEKAVDLASEVKIKNIENIDKKLNLLLKQSIMQV